MHAKLWTEVSEAVESFFDDLREHNASDNVLMIVFTEFGRRVRDNGTGTDHGSGGVAFALGDSVKGGYYNEYPSLEASELIQGDLKPNYDFRGFLLHCTGAVDGAGLDLHRWRELRAAELCLDEGNAEGTTDERRNELC